MLVLKRYITQCIPLKMNIRFGGLTYSSILKMEVTRSSETSIDFERTTRSYIQRNKTVRNYRCENLRSTRSFF
jgi:hypothetical protein